jgi:hypothetical protein
LWVVKLTAHIILYYIGDMDKLERRYAVRRLIKAAEIVRMGLERRYEGNGVTGVTPNVNEWT